VTQIDEHTELIHALDDDSAEWCETAIFWLEATIAKLTAPCT
jgi:hypothetical protein